MRLWRLSESARRRFHISRNFTADKKWPRSRDRIRWFRLCDLRRQSIEIFPADSARRKSGSTRIPNRKPAKCNRAESAAPREAKAGRRCDRAQHRKAKPRRSPILVTPSFGSNSGNENICVRRSGLAFSSDHREPSALIASEHCVRAFARIDPARNPEQLAQLQFHCGKPPPAAEPRTWIRTDLRS